MRRKITRIELIRVIKTGADRRYMKELLRKTTQINKINEITWLEDHNYSFDIVAEVETGGLVENTNWPNFDHAVIYLELDEETAIHYQLVWGGQ